MSFIIGFLILFEVLLIIPIGYICYRVGRRAGYNAAKDELWDREREHYRS